MSEPTLIAATKSDQWWKPKATNLLVILYSVILITKLSYLISLLLLLLSFLTIFGIASFGHLLNDWSDINADAHAGKRNQMAALGPWDRWFMLGAALATGLLPWIILPLNAVSVQLLVLEFGLLLAYSLPPIRLKERGVWAALTDGAYACAVPALLAAHTVFLAADRSLSFKLFGAILVWQLALGARHYLNHLALDRLNDIASGTVTIATVRGNRFIHSMIRQFVLPLEFFAFWGFMMLISDARPSLFLLTLFLFLLLSGLSIVLTLGRNYPLLPYRFSKNTLDRIYQDYLPLLLLVFIVFQDWRYGWLLLVHCLPFLIQLGRLAANTWLPSLSSATDGADTSPPGLHGRKVRSVDDRNVETDSKTVTTQAPQQRSDETAVPPAGMDRSSIAIANINKSKYTETFISGLIGRLDYNVHYIYGGELPQFDNDDRHFLSNWPGLQALFGFLETLFHLQPGYFLSNSIAQYLQARKVQLVLAEFGPVGVQMLPITRDLGIPLIVNFHAYDVYHDRTVKRYAAGYKQLFREADKIIGVSESMLERLQELGAPGQKLVHLPAYVNLELFPYTDHSATGARFLAVGRFAETKSPHLTILAFHRVARLIEDASLTLVGKGGGGELYEACLILVKALGLEDRVEFKGVLSHEQVAEEMRQTRVFIQHSVTTPEHGDKEGKPVAIMEAMASGLPVVTTRHSGIVELIDNGVNGYLVEEYDIDAMAAVMVMLAGDDDRVAKIGLKASRTIQSDPLIGNHVELLNQLIHNSIDRD